MYILGANFGPYYTEEYLKAMAKVFEKAEDVCFREKYSYQLFQNNRVRYAPDILFTYPMPKMKQQKNKFLYRLLIVIKKKKAQINFNQFRKYIQIQFMK
ncbi:putative transferase [Lachnospiraceae bacterium TWA4]|nr:putative transferase [Lachnospiraceae bacterium TWA4]